MINFSTISISISLVVLACRPTCAKKRSPLISSKQCTTAPSNIACTSLQIALHTPKIKILLHALSNQACMQKPP